MSFWNYIGEFLLFRWLFGNRTKNHNIGSSPPVDTTDSTRLVDIEDSIANDLDDDLRDMSDFNSSRYHSHNAYSNSGVYQSYDDFLDEQDGYDLMDDDF